MQSSSSRLLVIEWPGVGCLDLFARIRAGRLPVLNGLLKRGIFGELKGAYHYWPLQDGIAGMRKELGEAVLPELEPVTVEDLDEVVYRLFPADPDARSGLGDGLARLYSAQSEAVESLNEIRPRLIFAVQNLIEDIHVAYAASPCLSLSLEAGYRLLDVLLGDLLRQDLQRGVLICSRGGKGRSGFCLIACPGVASRDLPKVLHPSDLFAAIAQILEVRGAADGLHEDFSVSAEWRMPNVVDRRKLGSRLPPGHDREFHVCEGSAADLDQLSRVFPQNQWPEDGAVLLLLSAQEILGGAAWTKEGALSLAVVDGLKAPGPAQALVDAVIKSATPASESLRLVSPVVTGSMLHQQLIRAGFIQQGEVTVWLGEFENGLERSRRVVSKVQYPFRIRPVKEVDVERWRGQGGGELIVADVQYDPDISHVLLKEGRLCGIYLSRRLDQERIYIETFQIAPEVRRQGAFAFLLLQGLEASIRAGYRLALFTTGEGARELQAFAVRGKARVLSVKSILILRL